MCRCTNLLSHTFISSLFDLQVMTNNISDENVTNYSPDGSYRLWKYDWNLGEPDIILVHGFSVRMPLLCLPAPGHIREGSNNCFCQLGSFLHSDRNFNIWEFEYADLYPIYDPLVEKNLYFNVNDLTTYGTRLMQAIGIVQGQNPGVNINIVAHSMGGLIARYATKCMPTGTISKIVTLDTGHLGFELANAADSILHAAGVTLPPDVHCSQDAEENSAFIQHLNENFDPSNPELLSLAAQKPMPLPFPPLPPATYIRVVDWHSSSMGQIGDDGHSTDVDYHMQYFRLPYDHMSIAQINDRDHQAYEAITGYF